MDLKMLLQKTKEIAPDRSNSEEAMSVPQVTNGYKVLYPMRGETIIFKFLPNVLSNTIIKTIDKHSYRLESGFGQSAPCLKKMFNMDCPICNTMDNIAKVKGDEIFSQDLPRWPKRKFFSFVYICEIKNKSQNHNDIKAGEIVLLGMPNVVGRDIIKIMEDHPDEASLSKMFDSNECLEFSLSVANEASPSMYTIMPNPFPTSSPKMFATDEEYKKVVNSLPDLRDMIIPTQTFNEDYLKLAQQYSNNLSKNYLSGSVEETTLRNIENETTANSIINQVAAQVATQPQVEIPVQQVVQSQVNEMSAAQVVQQSTTIASQPIINNTPVVEQVVQQPIIPQTPEQPTITVSQPQVQTINPGLPPCFGQFKDSEAKCIICEHSVDCSSKKMNI